MLLGLAVWAVVVGLKFQPEHHRPPVIYHATPLDAPNVNLPTLGPSAR